MTDAAGVIVDGVHVLPVRVYFEDTDAAGMVFYANYLKFAERGRTEYLRTAGLDHSRLMDGGEKGGVTLVVRRCETDYLRSARLDDMLEVRTRITAVGGASVDMNQWVRRADEDLVRMNVRLACISSDGRPTRLPADVRRAFDEFCFRE
ncbi:MAG: tol-pal system-associated acyl-CoA thioesterase [Rhodospirillales bacterium]|nr:tol-pal system-associated acyl-CoA thioesterase [Rhodospirillales bacterium]